MRFVRPAHGITPESLMRGAQALRTSRSGYPYRLAGKDRSKTQQGYSMSANPINKTELADRLAFISGELYDVAGDMYSLGWAGHSSELISMSSLSSIYANQLRGKAERDAAELDEGAA